MPAQRRSLALTESYRARLLATRAALQARAERLWPTIEALDDSRWVERMAAATTQGQIEAIRLSAAYLGAFATSELGRRQQPPRIGLEQAGLSFDGRPLVESLRSPIIGVYGYLKEGLSASESLSRGLHRATRMVGVDFDHAHRTALLAAIADDDRFDGWQRSLAGTCGACASVASGLSHALYFPVHPGCCCVSSPVVRGLPNTFPIPTGVEVFNAKSDAEQDEMLGPEAAALVRAGEITLDDLRGHSELAEAPDFITQRPISALIN